MLDELIVSLQALERELPPYQLEVKPMNITDEQEAEFQASKQCYMCKEPFYEDSEKWHKVRDHNHATGEYGGAAHAACNLNKRRSTHIPVFFHNLRGYDTHLIIRIFTAIQARRQLKKTRQRTVEEDSRHTE